jgi:hypothetical protein
VIQESERDEGEFDPENAGRRWDGLPHENIISITYTTPQLVNQPGNSPQPRRLFTGAASALSTGTLLGPPIAGLDPCAEGGLPLDFAGTVLVFDDDDDVVAFPVVVVAVEDLPDTAVDDVGEGPFFLTTVEVAAGGGGLKTGEIFPLGGFTLTFSVLLPLPLPSFSFSPPTTPRAGAFVAALGFVFSPAVVELPALALVITTLALAAPRVVVVFVAVAEDGFLALASGNKTLPLIGPPTTDFELGPLSTAFLSCNGVSGGDSLTPSSCASDI